MSLANPKGKPCLAIIGGTGIDALPGFVQRDQINPQTPFGETSGALLLGSLYGKEVAIINRHGLFSNGGAPQHIPPHAINYRANIWALSRLGVQNVLGLNAVGGISPEWPPGRLGTPDDLVDYTSGRQHSYFDPDSPMPFTRHVELTPPFNKALAEKLQQAASTAGITFSPSGVVGVTNGPRLETVAEIKRLEQDGCDLVGMTSMPEASLAAELEMPYASVAFCVNWAAGKAMKPSDGSKAPSKGIHDEIGKTISLCQAQLELLLREFVAQLSA